MPLEPTAVMLAAAALAVLSEPPQKDIDLARRTVPLVALHLRNAESADVITGTLATMPAFYRAMLSAGGKE